MKERHRGVRWTFLKLALALALSCVTIAQSQTPRTFVVRVNADGSFTPQITYIKSGDTVRWERLTRTDSVIPVSGSEYPAMCTTRKGYNAADVNNFAGPMPYAPSGVYTLSPLDRGYIEAVGGCPLNRTPIAAGDNGKVLCAGGEYEATLDSTWRSPDLTGVFVRLLWNDINPSPGVYDFTVLQRELDKAVQSGKLYSLGIKAGGAGTPDWIFSTSANDAPRTGGGGGVPRLHLRDHQDASDYTTMGGCGTPMDLGNPVNLTYQRHYNAMLTEIARFIKTRADWYRALAYIKISGANLFSHENRLPRNCVASCTCNPAILAADGYRPSGLYAFYAEQVRLLQDLFPGKPMSYAEINDGFPRINETGGYETSTGVSSNGAPLPGFNDQTQAIMDGGQRLQGLNFVVQHNGVRRKLVGCPFDGLHPKPLRPLSDYEGPPGGCPNRWAVREGAEGQITGFQTANNEEGVATMVDLDSTFQNTWDNSDGIFHEIYEDKFWEAVNTNGGVLPTSRKTIGAWAEDFHRRRNDPIFPQYVAAKDPFPSTYSFTFRNTGATPQYFYYVHGMKCGAGKQEWGVIVMDPNSYNAPNRGGTTLSTSGAPAVPTTGYGRIQPNVGGVTPSGVAIFSYRSGQTLVSETGVPAVPPIRSGRIYAEVNGAVDTGLAIANPNDQAATINFNFTNAAGVDLGFQSTTIPPNQQLSKFLDEAPFKTFPDATFQGTFSFTSDVPVGVIAIQSLVNERSDFLMSTLPVVDLTANPVTGAVVVPHFSDGLGWTTQLFLVNPAAATLTGNLEFRNDDGALTNVTIAGQTRNTFPYTVPPRSSQKLATSGVAPETTSGSIRILPANNGSAPAPLVVFSYRPGTVTLAQAGVGSATGTAFRMYVESSGTDGSPGNIQSGIAIANTSGNAAPVTLELTNLDGSVSGLPAPVVKNVAAFGHSAQFLNQFFPSGLPNPFKGILRVSTPSSGVAVVGLRARYNERRDFLITTTPPANEAAPAATTEFLFPQLADGGGYTTQFVLFSGTPGQSSTGSLILVQQSGLPFTRTLALLLDQLSKYRLAFTTSRSTASSG